MQEKKLTLKSLNNEENLQIIFQMMYVFLLQSGMVGWLINDF